MKTQRGVKEKRVQHYQLLKYNVVLKRIQLGKKRLKKEAPISRLEVLS